MHISPWGKLHTITAAERVEERKKNMHPAVDLKGHALTSKHAHASSKCQEIPQAHLFKPLFPVGSLVLARARHTGQATIWNLMCVKWALGRYEFILSDSNQWSVRRLI